MQLIVTEQPIGLLVATYVKARITAAQKLSDNPFVIGLPTGGTAVDMYKYLVQFYREGKLSFKNVISFNLDEYVGLPQNHPESYYSYMHTNLFSHVDMPPQNINIPNGNAQNLPAFCTAYEQKIKDLGGIDLFLGGVGVNGHIAFNEPGSPFDSITRVVDLTQSTIQANARFFNNDITIVPKQAVTMGLVTIYAAKEVVVMACGPNKAPAVHKAIEGAADINWPISSLKTHHNCYLVADATAVNEISTAARDKFCKCSFKPI